MTRTVSTECLLPLPATKEWGEGRPCKHCTKTTSTGSRHPSPWPSPRRAGRGNSRRRVVYPAVSSVMANCSLRARTRFPYGRCSEAAIASGADQIFRHRFAAGAGVEFFVDMLKVGLDCGDRNLERIGDFFGARALHDLTQNVFLAPSEFFAGGSSRLVLVKRVHHQ